LNVKAHVVFHPDWWYENFGISFEEDFFFDYGTRIVSEKLMKKGLYEKFGDIGLGEKNPKDEPIVGTYNIAAGWFLEHMLGCNLIFSKDNSPEVRPKNISKEEIKKLEVPNFPNNNNKYFQKIKKVMDKMEERFGYLTGDLDLQGVQNIAASVRGQELYVDYYNNPELVHILFGKITDTMINAAKYFKNRTGSCSLGASPTIMECNPSLFVTSNCTVDIVSVDIYENFIFEFDNMLSDNLKPFGIHHCGKRSDEFSYIYSKVKNVTYYEAGWGGDIERIRKNFPSIFISARLSPVKILDQSDDELINDIVNIVKNGSPLNKLIISVYGIDHRISDDKIKLIFSVCNNIENYL
jgi:uroporphyrinogen-III decarboxylase